MSRTWVSNSANSSTFANSYHNKTKKEPRSPLAIGEPGRIKGLENKRSKNLHSTKEVLREPRLC